MNFPRIKLSHNALPPNQLLLVGPTFGVILAAVLLLPLFFLLPQPDLTASAQGPSCDGDYTCDEPEEDWTWCGDCIQTCEGANWCVTGVGESPAGCPDYTAYDGWAYVPNVQYCGGLGCCLSVESDDDPPVTTAILDGTHGLDDWFLSPVTVTLSATDNWSGVFSTNLDGEPYTGPRLYDAEGATTIAYQSYDLASNLEPLKTTTFFIDTVKPASLIASPSSNGWVGGVTTIAGISVDETSGMAGVDVSFDGGVTWLPATGGEVWSYQWDTRAMAVNVVQVRGRDQAGNIEEPITFAVSIDNSTPFFDVGPFPSEYCFTCSGPLPFTLTAFDEESHISNSAIVVKQNGKDIRVLQAPAGELRGTPVVWDGRDAQGQMVPVGDYQLLFYTANYAGMFASYSANFKVVDALPAGGIVPAAAPLAPASPPDDAPWILTPNPPQPTMSAPMAAAIERMTGGKTQSNPSQGGSTAQAALSRLAGARAGQTSSSNGAVGTGIGGLLVLAAAYIAGQQATGNLNLGKKLAQLSAVWKPAAKPAAPAVPANLAPPAAPPPPPPSPPRSRMLRWFEVARPEPEPPAPPPVVYYPPKPKPSYCPYYANPWPAIPFKPKPKVTHKPSMPNPPYANPWATQHKPSMPNPPYANPWPAPHKPSMPNPPYANPWPAKSPTPAASQPAKPNGLFGGILSALGLGAPKPSSTPTTSKPGGGGRGSGMGTTGVGGTTPAIPQKTTNQSNLFGGLLNTVKKTGSTAWEWMDQHQTETSIGVGIGVGVAAIAGAAALVAAGVVALPVLAVAGIALGVGAVAMGGLTMALNATHQRPLGQNLVRNSVLAGGIAGLVPFAYGPLASAGGYFAGNVATLGSTVGLYGLLSGTITSSFIAATWTTGITSILGGCIYGTAHMVDPTLSEAERIHGRTIASTAGAIGLAFMGATQVVNSGAEYLRANTSYREYSAESTTHRGNGRNNDPTLSYGSNAGTGGTGANSVELKDNMKVTGTVFQGTEQAHHIVPSTHPYESARKAREILHNFDIDINSAANGAPLSVPIHSPLHNEPYMDTILHMLEQAKTRGEALQILDEISRQIETAWSN